MNTNTDPEAGSGWLIFAGTIMGIAGVMRIFDAIWAFGYDASLPDQLEGAILGTTFSTYGWFFLVVGLLLLLSSFAVLSRSQFARWVGIASGAVMVISAMPWMPYYPVWSLTYVGLGTLTVYALAAHGGRPADA